MTSPGSARIPPGGRTLRRRGHVPDRAAFGDQDVAVAALHRPLDGPVVPMLIRARAGVAVVVPCRFQDPFPRPPPRPPRPRGERPDKPRRLLVGVRVVRGVLLPAVPERVVGADRQRPPGRLHPAPCDERQHVAAEPGRPPRRRSGNVCRDRQPGRRSRLRDGPVRARVPARMAGSPSYLMPRPKRRRPSPMRTRCSASTPEGRARPRSAATPRCPPRRPTSPGPASGSPACGRP